MARIQCQRLQKMLLRNLISLGQIRMPLPFVVSSGRLQPKKMDGLPRDRKSTRLNSSHVAISYAVFCLKKKKNSLDLWVDVPEKEDNVEQRRRHHAKTET